jgi:hypothetical protein
MEEEDGCPGRVEAADGACRGIGHVPERGVVVVGVWEVDVRHLRFDSKIGAANVASWPSRVCFSLLHRLPAHPLLVPMNCSNDVRFGGRLIAEPRPSSTGYSTRTEFFVAGVLYSITLYTVNRPLPIHGFGLGNTNRNGQEGRPWEPSTVNLRMHDGF